MRRLYPDRDWADGERRAIWRRVFILEEKLLEAVHNIEQLQQDALSASRPRNANPQNPYDFNDEIPF